MTIFSGVLSLFANSFDSIDPLCGNADWLMQEISFYEQYEWSASRNAMKFWAVVDGNPLQCWVEEATLNTFSQADSDGQDESKNVQAHFLENREHIHGIARNKIEQGQLDEDGSITIGVGDIASGPT